MEGTSNGTRPERRDITSGVYGVKRELPGGGWIRVLPRAANVAMLRKRDELQQQRRTERGLAIDQPLALHDTLELTMRMLLGTVITGWGDFVIDGREVVGPAASHRPDQPLEREIEDAGVLVLSPLDIQKEVYEILESVDAQYRKDVEVAEGNSPKGSAGS